MTTYSPKEPTYQVGARQKWVNVYLMDGTFAWTLR